MNRLHNLAFETDQQRRARLEARLSQALENASAEQWEQLERDLDEMVAQRQQQLETAPVAGIGRRNDGSSNAGSGVRREAA